MIFSSAYVIAERVGGGWLFPPFTRKWPIVSNWFDVWESTTLQYKRLTAGEQYFVTYPMLCLMYLSFGVEMLSSHQSSKKYYETELNLTIKVQAKGTLVINASYPPPLPRRYKRQLQRKQRYIFCKSRHQHIGDQESKPQLWHQLKQGERRRC